MTSTSQITYDKMSKRVFDFLDWAGIDKCVVMGHSMGGKVGMVMATGDEQERLEVRSDRLSELSKVYHRRGQRVYLKPSLTPL